MMNLQAWDLRRRRRAPARERKQLLRIKSSPLLLKKKQAEMNLAPVGVERNLKNAAGKQYNDEPEIQNWKNS